MHPLQMQGTYKLAFLLRLVVLTPLLLSINYKAIYCGGLQKINYQDG